MQDTESGSHKCHDICGMSHTVTRLLRVTHHLMPHRRTGSRRSGLDPVPLPPLAVLLLLQSWSSHRQATQETLMTSWSSMMGSMMCWYCRLRMLERKGPSTTSAMSLGSLNYTNLHVNGSVHTFFFCPYHAVGNDSLHLLLLILSASTICTTYGFI